MKFLFICGREIDYTRNQVLLRAFRKLGEVDLVDAGGKSRSLILRSIRLAIRSFPKYISRRYDLIFVGFYGHLLMLPIGIFARQKILFDAFVSTYDTLISDRQSFSDRSLVAWLALLLDKSACRLADRVLLDTSAQEEYFSTRLGVPKEKLRSLPVSCNEEIFFPRDSVHASNITHVLGYSTYLPIHGMRTISEAANVLRDEPIEFKLIGDGLQYKEVSQYIATKGLTKITLSPPVLLNTLAGEIAESDICLGGHFGASKKAARVIPGKIYQMMAMRKPIIAADTLANNTILEHERSAYMCPPDDPVALSRAILALHHDPEMRNRISLGARSAYEKACSEAFVMNKLKLIISEMLAEN